MRPIFHRLMFMCVLLGLVACESTPAKKEDTQPKAVNTQQNLPKKPKVKSIPEPEVRKQLNLVFKRGVNHGLGIGVTSLMIKTRNFESVWDAFLQNITRFPTLVPYVLGFLDSVRTDDPPLKSSEERRTARQVAKSLFKGSNLPNEAFKERCYLILLKIVELAQNSEVEDHLLPLELRSELKNEIKREIQLNIKGERLNYASRILALIRTPENLERDLKLFENAVNDKRWELAEATMPNVDSSPDKRVLVVFQNALQKLIIADEQAAFAAKLLRSIAKRNVDTRLLSFATAAVNSKKPIVLQTAGTFALGRFYKAESESRKAALLQLFTVLNAARDTGLQLGTLLQIQRFPSAEILNPLTAAKLNLEKRPRGAAPEVVEAVRKAIQIAKGN